MQLHLAEQVRIRPADGQGFLASLRPERDASGFVVQVDHRASMDLLEAIARQLREQLLQRCANQRLAEMAELATRNHPDRVACPSANDA